MNTAFFKTARSQDLEHALPLVRNDEQNPFEVMTSEKLAELPIVRERPFRCNHGDACNRGCRQNYRRTLMQQYDASMKKIATWHQELVCLLVAVVEAFVWRHDRDDLYKAKLKSEIKQMPQLVLEVADVLRAEIMVQEEEQIREILIDAVSETVGRLFSSFEDTLRSFRNNGIVGEITWLAGDVCKYNFHRARRIERKVAEKFEEHEETKIAGEFGGRTSTTYKVRMRVDEIGTLDVHEFHEHHLFNATRNTLPAFHVPRPHFVQKFVPVIPKWMYPHTFIVAGDMLRDDIHEREYHVGSRFEKCEVSRQILSVGYLASPAVVIGDFVLTGWSGKDL